MTRYEYAITDGGGLWWNGRCFGPEQAREVYTSLDDLPEDIETNTGSLIAQEKHDTDTDHPHIVWYELFDDQAVAWVEVVSRQEVTP
jgi:hypothetical protein